MGNEDLTNCIPWYCPTHFKCEDIQDENGRWSTLSPSLYELIKDKVHGEK